MATAECLMTRDDHAAGASPSADEPTRVLLVEDDDVSLKILKKRIGVNGYAVETACDGLDGLEKIGTFKPHLVISDWMMPRMDGRELCKAIKGDKALASIYFILLTSRDKHEDIVHALDTGADEYLIKPCNGPELMARLRAAERLLHLRNALALSNEQLQSANARINKELQDISHLQRALLPQTLPTFPGFGFAAFYQPSTECSGDFYDLLPLDDQRIGIVIGDVSGHGAAAMVAMALIRMLYRMEAYQTDDPAQLLGRINRAMFQNLPTDQYATMFYGVLDRDTGRLRYSSAGHPPPLLLDRQTGASRYLSGCEGFPIKLIDPNVDYDNNEIALPEGHQMLFYTDGLNETFNPAGEIYGMDRLQRHASRLAFYERQDFIDRLLADLDDFRHCTPYGDDLSLLVVARD